MYYILHLLLDELWYGDLFKPIQNEYSLLKPHWEQLLEFFILFGHHYLILKHKLKNKFQDEVLICWGKLRIKKRQIRIHKIIWHNSKTIEGKMTLDYKHHVEREIIFINASFNKEGHFFTYADFTTMYNKNHNPRNIIL